MQTSLLVAAAVLACASSVSAGKWQCNNIVKRQEFSQLDDSKVQVLLRAINKLRDRSKTGNSLTFWDTLAKTHYEHNSYIHGNPLFLPWHRYYVAYVERELQKASGDNTLAIPYWNWDVDSEAPENSPIWTPGYFGTNGKRGGCVQDGAFANQQALIPSPHCLQREWSEGSSIGKVSSVDEIASIISRNRRYDDFRQKLEGVPHGTVHVNIGGDMAVMNSPNDPVFFLHHAKIDKVWWDWQNAHGFDTKNYGGMQTSFTGPNGGRGSTKSASLTDKLTPYDDWVVGDVFKTEALCYTYADASVDEAIPNIPTPSIPVPSSGTRFEDNDSDNSPPPRQSQPSSRPSGREDSGLSVPGHPHLSKLHDFFHGVFNAAPQDPASLPVGVEPKPIAGVKPADKTVTIRPAVAATAGDRAELLLLRTHKPLPEKWLVANNLDVSIIRTHEKDTKDLIDGLNKIPGFVSTSALWNRPKFVAKIAVTKKTTFKATINKAAIAVDVTKQTTENLQVAADIHAKVKVTLGLERLQDIDGVKVDVEKLLIGTDGIEISKIFTATSISNPLAQRKITKAQSSK